MPSAIATSCKIAADGSLTIYIQHESPGEGESNWLPAPPDAFNVFMRLYWPKQEILDGNVEAAASHGARAVGNAQNTTL